MIGRAWRRFKAGAFGAQRSRQERLHLPTVRELVEQDRDLRERRVSTVLQAHRAMLQIMLASAEHHELRVAEISREELRRWLRVLDALEEE